LNNTDVIIHLNPVWRERANFIIHAKIDANKAGKRFEQIWAGQINSQIFEICCIPFFVYDLALGDHVETSADEGKQYIVRSIVKQSGHFTFHVWFGKADIPSMREHVMQNLTELGCEFEWYSHNLLGVDARNEELAQHLADYLYGLEKAGTLAYETGRTR